MYIKELRIGNLIKHHMYNDLTLEVDIRILLDIVLAESAGNICVYDGIWLTQDWLLKFGFVPRSLPEKYATLGEIKYLHDPETDFKISEQNGNFYPVRIYDSISLSAYGAGINYVHQLQNLFYFLNNKELNFKP